MLVTEIPSSWKEIVYAGYCVSHETCIFNIFEFLFSILKSNTKSPYISPLQIYVPISSQFIWASWFRVAYRSKVIGDFLWVRNGAGSSVRKWSKHTWCIRLTYLYPIPDSCLLQALCWSFSYTYNEVQCTVLARMRHLGAETVIVAKFYTNWGLKYDPRRLFSDATASLDWDHENQPSCFDGASGRETKKKEISIFHFYEEKLLIMPNYPQA